MVVWKRRLKRLMPGPVREIYDPYRDKQRQADRNLNLQASLPYWERRQTGTGRTRIRVGFVGAGTYAQHHLQVLSDLDGVELAAILTAGGSRVQAVASNYGIKRVFSNAEQFLDQDDIDCFVVVVPAQYIHEVAMSCLSTGKPVLLEKPAGFSAAQTEELAAQALKFGTTGMVCMNRRFYSIVEHGLAALASCGPLRGAILEVPEAISQERASGRLTPIEYNHFMFRNSVHAIDMIRYILGDVRAVRGFSQANADIGNAAATYAAAIEHENGALSTVIALWDTTRIWRMKVIAEQAWLEFENFQRGWFVHGSQPELRIPLTPDPVDVSFRGGIYAQDLHFIEAVRQATSPFLPASLLHDAAKTNHLIEDIYCRV